MKVEEQLLVKSGDGRNILMHAARGGDQIGVMAVVNACKEYLCPSKVRLLCAKPRPRYKGPLLGPLRILRFGATRTSGDPISREFCACMFLRCAKRAHRMEWFVCLCTAPTRCLQVIF